MKQRGSRVLQAWHAGPIRSGRLTLCLALCVAATALAWFVPSAGAQGGPDVVWMKQLDGAVGGVAFSPDGQLLASGDNSWPQSAKIWQSSDGIPIRALAGSAWTRSVAFSPNGEILATAGEYAPAGQSIADLWRVADGVLIRTLALHYDYDWTEGGAVAFAPDGQTVAGIYTGAWAFYDPEAGPMIYKDCRLDLWRVADGTCVWSSALSEWSSGAYSVAFCPDGKTVAALMSDSGRVGIVRASDGEVTRWLDLPGYAWPHCLAYSPDGGTLACGDGSGDITLWRTSDWSLERTIETSGSGIVASVAFSPDGQTLVSGGDTGYPAYLGVIDVWRVSDGTLLQRYDEEMGTGVRSVAFSPDGSRFAYGRYDAALVMARNPMYATAPQNWFVPGWVWFSIPLTPAGSAAASDLLGFDATNRVYGWDDALKSFRLCPDDFTDLAVGPSYLALLRVGEGYRPAYMGTSPTKPFEWTLPAAGWCWVGVPGSTEIPGANVCVRKDGVTRTAQEDRDAANPWLNWNWIYWDTIGQTARMMSPFPGADDATVHPWYGYRVWATTEDVTIIFP